MLDFKGQKQIERNQETLLYKILVSIKPLTRIFLKKILYVSDKQNSTEFFIECVICLLCFVWTLSFLDEVPSPQNLYAASDSFLHNINLVFHEAGHLIFYPFGKFLAYLGGSLLQCLIPFICLIYFLTQRINFSASAMFWWLGQNFMDIAPYIYDAKALSLVLLGGHIGKDNPQSHDWFWLLSRMGLLGQYSDIALFINNLGRICMILSIVWSVCLLYKKGILLKEAL